MTPSRKRDREDDRRPPVPPPMPSAAHGARTRPREPGDPREPRRPGLWLRALSARLCDAQAMTSLIDPIVADLQHEQVEAWRDGATWRGRRSRLAGCFALIKVLMLVQGGRVMEGLQRITTSDRMLARVVPCSILAMAAATAVLMLPPLQTLSHVDPRLALYAVPQTLPLTIPFGLIMGMLIAFDRRVISRRAAVRVLMLGAACSGLVFVTQGWLVPSSNYAYQLRVAERYGSPVTSDGSSSGEPLWKGPHELTLPEFRRRYLRLTATAIAAGVPRAGAEEDEPRSLSFLYHLRWALPCASLVFVLVALSVTRHRRAIRITASLAATAVYSCFFWLFASSNAWAVAPPGVLAWLPNTVIAGAALAWMAAARVRPEPQVAMGPTDRLLPP